MGERVDAGGSFEGSDVLPNCGQSESLSNLRPVSIATGLPWHVATGRLDKQLLTAAKKDNLKNHHTVITDMDRHNRSESMIEEEWFGENPLDVSLDEALQRGADVNSAGHNGNTALHYACEEGYEDVVKFLLNVEDIYIEAISTMDWTALHCAAYKGRTKIVRMLLDAGCNKHAFTRDGANALHIAARGGHLETVQILIERGVDLGVRNDEGLTAVDLARRFKNRQWQAIVEAIEVGPETLNPEP